jgi:hypothetical protein
MAEQNEKHQRLNKAASLIFSVYVHRLYALATAVRDRCDAIFKAAPVPHEDGYFKISDEIHAQIDAVLVDAANIRKLIDTPATKGSSESTRVFEFRRERTRLLSEFLKGIPLESILDSQARNSLEHFDQYLDKLGARLNAGELAPQPMALFNIIFSSWSYVRDAYPIRVYIADEQTYYNFDRKVSLGALHAEAAAILARIEESGVFKDMPDPGGLFIVFPPTARSGS